MQSRVSDGWNAGLWSHIDEMGLPLLLVPDADGGIGGQWDDVHVVLHALGAHAIALPVGEAMLARRLLAFAAIEAPEGLIGLAPRANGTLHFERGDRQQRTTPAHSTACRGGGNCSSSSRWRWAQTVHM